VLIGAALRWVAFVAGERVVPKSLEESAVDLSEEMTEASAKQAAATKEVGSIH